MREYALLDSKTNEIADWDFDMLQEELEELDFSDFDFDWGIEDKIEEKEIIEDNYEEPNNLETKVKKGDIWQLGEHRLMCGDSTDALNINILMQGKKADLVFTDPPYGMKKEKDGVANDNLNFDDLLLFNKQWIPLTFDALKDNGSWYCWGIDEPLMDIYSEILKPMIRKNKITFRNLITWDKGSGQGQLSSGYRMYSIADEKCLFVMVGQQMYGRDLETWYEPFQKFIDLFKCEMEKAGATTKDICDICNSSAGHYIDRSQYAFPTANHWNKLKDKYKGIAFMQDYEKIKQDYEKIKQDWYSTRAYFDNTHDNMNNVWHFSKTSGEERETAGGHATPKPIALCSRAIKSSSREGEIVLDVFGGSGSTLIACEQLNRKAYLMELEPKWCDVIIKRWEYFTGEKAVKIN